MGTHTRRECRAHVLDNSTGMYTRMLRTASRLHICVARVHADIGNGVFMCVAGRTHIET